MTIIDFKLSVTYALYKHYRYERRLCEFCKRVENGVEGVT